MKRIFCLFSFIIALSLGLFPFSSVVFSAEEITTTESDDKNKEALLPTLEEKESLPSENENENSTTIKEDTTETSYLAEEETEENSKEEDEELEKEKKPEKEKKSKKKKKSKAVIGYTKEELQILACVVFLESGNQPFDGKVAVANTIINRVRQSGFPNTIKKVIHHKTKSGYQFDLAKPGGTLEKAMKVFGKRKIAWEKKAEKESFNAAKAALFGKETIPDHLCFFVMKNSDSGRSFRKNKPGGVIIKDHYFYKW